MFLFSINLTDFSETNITENKLQNTLFVELRDKDDRYLGKGVLNAVNNVNTILRDNLIGMNVTNQKEIDLLGDNELISINR